MHRLFLNKRLFGRAASAVNIVAFCTFSTAVCEGAPTTPENGLLGQIRKASEAIISPQELEELSRNINANLHNSGLSESIKEAVPALEAVITGIPIEVRSNQ